MSVVTKHMVCTSRICRWSVYQGVAIWVMSVSYWVSLNNYILCLLHVYIAEINSLHILVNDMVWILGKLSGSKTFI